MNKETRFLSKIWAPLQVKAFPIILPLLAMVGVIGVGIFHYLRAASTPALSQAEVALFTVIELCLSIYASWTISAYFARRTAIQESTETSRLFGSAAIRRVEGMVDSLDRLESFLRKRKESIVHSTELSPGLIQEYLDHAEDNTANIRATALSAIEDWAAFSGVPRESTSVYRQLVTRSKQLQVQLDELNSDLERNKDAAKEEKEKQQNNIDALREKLTQVQRELIQHSDNLFGTRSGQIKLGISGDSPFVLSLDPSERPTSSMSEKFGTLIPSTTLGHHTALEGYIFSGSLSAVDTSASARLQQTPTISILLPSQGK